MIKPASSRMAAILITFFTVVVLPCQLHAEPLSLTDLQALIDQTIQTTDSYYLQTKVYNKNLYINDIDQFSDFIREEWLSRKNGYRSEEVNCGRRTIDLYKWEEGDLWKYKFYAFGAMLMNKDRLKLSPVINKVPDPLQKVLTQIEEIQKDGLVYEVSEVVENGTSLIKLTYADEEGYSHDLYLQKASGMPARIETQLWNGNLLVEETLLMALNDEVSLEQFVIPNFFGQTGKKEELTDAFTDLIIEYAGYVKPEVALGLVANKKGISCYGCDALFRDKDNVVVSQTVPATLRGVFGVAFRIEKPKGPMPAYVDLKMVIDHPPLWNPYVKKEFTKAVVQEPFKIGPVGVFSWIFSEDWEIVPGRWTFSIYSGDKKLSEQVFDVREEIVYDPGQDLWSPQMDKFKQAFTANPKDVSAITSYGNGFYHMGYKLKALEQYHKAVKIDPKFPDVHHALCWTYQDREEFEKSYEACSQAISLRPGYLYAINNRGNTLLKMGRLNEAIKDFDHAIKLNPKFYEPYVNKGLALNYLKRYDEALKVLDEAIRIAPAKPSAHKIRARTYAALGQTDKARDELKTLIKMDPLERAYVMKYLPCLEE